MMKFAGLFLAATLAGSSAWAQMLPGTGGAPGMNPEIAKFFGNNTAFSAKAQFRVEQTAGQPPVTMGMNFFMLEGKVRTEMDMTKVEGGNMRPESMASVKEMGMDKMTSISCPEKKTVLLIFPSLKAYAESPLPNPQAAPTSGPKEPKVKTTKTALGKETIDGHPCEKTKMVLTDQSGQQKEALVWNATDLKDFPVQIQMNEQGSTIQIRFQDVKLQKPDPKLFEAPAAFTKYSSPQELMQGEVMKRMGASRQ